ncbi:MAG: hypothetical protein LR011_09250 [Verrucomicrobia bacterium]|nr:hypothetical protein [Verrucomicrobiota bacterium]
MAEEVREIMAQLGFRKMDDMIGRTDMLERKPLDAFPDEIRSKVAGIDLSRLLYQVDPTGTIPRIHTRERNERFGDSSLDDKLIIDAKKSPEQQRPGQVALQNQQHHAEHWNQDLRTHWLHVW